MNTRYQYSVHIFAKFDPAKYNSFEFHEVDNLEDARLYMDKEVKFCNKGNYYEYRGKREYSSVMKQPSRIEIKHQKKVIANFIL